MSFDDSGAISSFSYDEGASGISIMPQAGADEGAARRYEYKRDKPSREAGVTPRSVMKPVTSRAGVTSKA